MRALAAGASRWRSLVGSARREAQRRWLMWRGARMLPVDVDERPLWLFGAFAGARFGDNSGALFRHVVAHHPEIDARWVMNAGADQWSEVAAIGTVVPREQAGTYALARHAEALVISHGIHDVPLTGSDDVSAVKVRLGHGLTALKATGAGFGRSVDATMSRFDLVPVASEFEKSVKATWGVSGSASVITGLCRFDELQRLRAENATPDERSVLYVPTWREHDKGAGGENRFADVVCEFHRRVGSVLEQSGVALVTALHPLTPSASSDRIREAAPEAVHVLAANDDLQPYLATCDLLVTDYSGVTWDALSIDTPVVLFTFDDAQQHRTRPSHLPAEWGQPGHVVASAAQAADAVTGFVEGTFDPLPSDARALWRSRVLAFEDDQNCARVTAAILDRASGSATAAKKT